MTTDIRLSNRICRGNLLWLPLSICRRVNVCPRRAEKMREKRNRRRNCYRSLTCWAMLVSRNGGIVLELKAVMELADERRDQGQNSLTVREIRIRTVKRGLPGVVQ